MPDPGGQSTAQPSSESGVSLAGTWRPAASSPVVPATSNDGAPLDRGAYRHSDGPRCPCCGHLDVCRETLKRQYRDNQERARSSGAHPWIRHQGTVKVPPLRRFDEPGLSPRSRRRGGGRRGNVTEYSRAARLRHLRHLAQIRPDLMPPEPYMVTLTYPDEYPGKSGFRGSPRSDDLDPSKGTGHPDTSTAWQHLRVLLQRAQRRNVISEFEWRLEFQKRGAPHFHVIVWASSSTGSARTPAQLQAVLSAWWKQTVASDHPWHLTYGVKVTAGRDQKRALRYLSKYVSKEDHSGSGYRGRRWGHSRGVRTEPLETVTFIHDQEEVLARRVVRKWMRAQGKASRRFAKRLRNAGLTFEIFMGDGVWEQLVAGVRRQRAPPPKVDDLSQRDQRERMRRWWEETDRRVWSEPIWSKPYAA